MKNVGTDLDKIKELYEKVVGQPAPEIDPGSYMPFPPGVDPFEFVSYERRELERLSERTAFAPQPYAWIPTMDCFASTKDDDIVLLMEVPGVTKDSLEVFVADGALIVRGDRASATVDGELRPLALERPWGPFERRFPLPIGVAADQITARHHDGLLELRFAAHTATGLGESFVKVA